MQTNDNEDVRKKAKGYALRLLKLRPRSTAELAAKMASKGYDAVLSVQVIDELTRLGLLDDEAFAKAWLQCRLNKPMGFRRIAQELAEKGISKDSVRGYWDEVKENYDELEVVRTLVKKRARLYNNIDPLKRKKRVMDYLARRGFQLDIIMKVIKEI